MKGRNSQVESQPAQGCNHPDVVDRQDGYILDPHQYSRQRRESGHRSPVAAAGDSNPADILAGIPGTVGMGSPDIRIRPAGGAHAEPGDK